MVLLVCQEWIPSTYLLTMNLQHVEKPELGFRSHSILKGFCLSDGVDVCTETFSHQWSNWQGHRHQRLGREGEINTICLYCSPLLILTLAHPEELVTSGILEPSCLRGKPQTRGSKPRTLLPAHCSFPNCVFSHKSPFPSPSQRLLREGTHH